MVHIKTFDEFCGEPLDEGLFGFGSKSIYDAYILWWADVRRYAQEEGIDQKKFMGEWTNGISRETLDDIIKKYGKIDSLTNSTMTIEKFTEAWNRSNENILKGKYLRIYEGKKRPQANMCIYMLRRDLHSVKIHLGNNCKDDIGRMREEDFRFYVKREERSDMKNGMSEEKAKRHFTVREFCDMMNRLNCAGEGDFKPEEYYIRVCRFIP
jgi:hypothetical protein